MRRFLIGACILSASLTLSAESKGQPPGPFPPGSPWNMYTTNRYGFVVTRPLNGSSAAPMTTYGAIAYSKSTGVYGYAWGQDSRADAERVALRNCDGSDASIEVHGKNAWIAFAHGSDGSSGWAWSEHSATDARQRAVALCAKHGAVGRIQGASLHTSSSRTWAKFEAQGNAPPQKSEVASDSEFFAPNLQIHFQLVKVGGATGARLTRSPSANSPALHILVNGSPVYLEPNDAIVALDSLPIRNAADVFNHVNDTTITFVDHRTGRTFNGMMTLPAYAQTSYAYRY
jgi:Domain of unknown function (DUF4189)